MLQWSIEQFAESIGTTCDMGVTHNNYEILKGGQLKTIGWKLDPR